MRAIRTIQRVNGQTLTVAVPADLAGQQVEVIILPLETGGKPLPPEQNPRYAAYIMAKPSLTPEQQKEFERDPNLLRGTVLEYSDPYGPAAPAEDWDVYREDGADDPS